MTRRFSILAILMLFRAVCLFAVSAAFADLPTGTVAYWGFNNALTDGSANGNTLKGTSGTVQYSTSTAKFGSASLYLDGTTTLGTLSGSFPTGVPTGANPYTVAAWIKADTGCSLNGGWIGYGNNANSQGNNFRLNGSNNSVWEYWYNNDFGATLASGNFFDGWHSVVGTWDGATEKMYLDGVATTRSPNPTGLSVGTTMFIVGKTTNDANFKGWVDDLLILSRAMSASEVATYQVNGAVAGPTVNITASAGAGGAISPSGVVVVGQGSSQQFTITPNTGYAISGVTVDGVNQGAIATYTFTNVQAAHTISAAFVALPTYTITASAGANGTISPSGAVAVYQGYSQTFTITPNAGYSVSAVAVDGVNQGAITSYTFTNVTATHTISATFIALVTVSGTVKDTYGVPLAGVVATGGGTSFTTGADGQYTLTYQQGASVTITAINNDYIVTNPSGGSYNLTIGSVNLTGKDFTMVHTKTIKGVVKNAGGVGIYNAIVQVGGTSGPATVTDKDGKYEINSIPTASGTEIYADALGCADNTQTVNTSPAATTTMELDIVLTARTEVGVIVNGGFESVSAGKPTDWTSDGPVNVSSTSAVGEFFSGTYGAKITPGAGSYSYLTQRIPVVAGSTYNVYWKMKGDALPIPAQTTAFPYAPTNYDEPYRGQFHFSPQGGWMNDVNGIWYYKGTYYMTFQHNPHGLGWATMHWGMATSTDMMHWVQKPIALEPGVNVPGDCFSGSVVVDTANTSGFQTGSKPVFVAIYTATSTGTCLAYSNDLGASWQAYSGNPVAIGGHDAGTRDPHVFWYAPTNKWVCAEYQNGITFYTSSDLKNWTQASNIGFGFECPDMHELAVDDGSTKKWVVQDASDNYLVGTFNGATFTPDAGGPWRMDVGPNFYASQTFHRKTFPDNRVIQMAWMTGNLGTSPWTHEASFPCEIKLKTFPEGVRVTRTPIAEIANLYDSSTHWNAQTVSSSSTLFSAIRSKCFDLSAEFDLTGATATAINFVLPGRTVTYNIAAQTLLGTTLTPISNHVKIRMLVDWGELEVFGNDGKLSWTENVNFTPADSSISLSVNGNVNLVSMDFHSIKRTWQSNPPGAAGIFQHVTFIDSTQIDPNLAIKSEVYSDQAGIAPTDWTEFLPNIGTQKTRFTIPAGADTMQVQLGVTDVFSTGKSLCFDDVVVDRVGSTPVVTITASAGTGGAIGPSGAVPVNQGSNQTFTITANVGYAISQVTVDGVNQGAISSYTFTNVQTTHTISVSFVTVPTSTITASAGTGGTISPSGSVVVNQGSNQTFTITPNTGYNISQVTVDGVNQGAITSYTFSNVKANHTIAAAFALQTFTITASAGANGSISPSGTVTKNYGESQTYTLTPNAGYMVSQVTVDGVSQGSITSYTFSNVAANHTISVTFSVYTTPPPVAFYQFENNVLDTQGAYNGTAYNSPTYVTGKIGAKAIQFNGSSQYVTIPRPVSDNWTISFWVKTTQTSPTGSWWYLGNGLVDGEVAGITNDYGVVYLNSKVAFGVGNPDTTIQSVSAINSGNWVHVACTRDSVTGQMKIYINGALETTGTGPTGSRTSPSTLHIGNLQTNLYYFNGAIDQLKIYNAVLTASDISYLANEGTTFTITVSAVSHGSISPGTVSVNYGANQTFTTTPNAGYIISQVTVDGVNQGAIATYTFTSVTANHTISATFVKPLGVKSKSVLTDQILPIKLGTDGRVRTWGKVVSIDLVNNPHTFQISDGYSGNVTVIGEKSGINASTTYVVVTGMLANHKVTAAAADIQIVVP